MKNQNGLTLVELLVAMTIGSMILIMTFSLIMQSKAQHDDQYNDTQKIMQISQIMHMLTSDIRKSISFSNNDNVITLQQKDGADIVYRYDEPLLTLFRNESSIITNLSDFSITANSSSVFIQMKNLKNESLSTTIYLRRD